MTSEKVAKLTSTEIDKNVNLARAASEEAVSKFQHADDAPVEENRLQILAMTEKIENQPSQLSSRLQAEKVSYLDCVFHPLHFDD